MHYYMQNNLKSLFFFNVEFLQISPTCWIWICRSKAQLFNSWLANKLTSTSLSYFPCNACSVMLENTQIITSLSMVYCKKFSWGIFWSYKLFLLSFLGRYFFCLKMYKIYITRQENRLSFLFNNFAIKSYGLKNLEERFCFRILGCYYNPILW